MSDHWEAGDCFPGQPCASPKRQSPRSPCPRARPRRCSSTRIIPAPEGYSVVRAFKPEKAGCSSKFDTDPVIAFRLTEGEPVPVTPFGKLGDHWALVWPDGRCDEQWNRLWRSVGCATSAAAWFWSTRGEALTSRLAQIGPHLPDVPLVVQ